MKSHTEIAVQLRHVTKEYVIHHEKPTLVEKFYTSVSRRGEEKFIAFNDVSLTIKKGERVGIIGPNGSGKTTLLKMIAGITAPTSGTITTQGKIVSLIDLEAGFHPDLTGYQNIMTNGLLLGMKKSEVNERIQDIIDFADIRQFIDIPLFMYSSGMKLRLGFSVAVNTNPDIILLDEAMYAGDQEFFKRSDRKLKEFFREGKTIVVATHWLPYLKHFCDRIIIMKYGRVTKQGDVSILKEYEKSSARSMSTSKV